jgi:hypothetical protein
MRGDAGVGPEKTKAPSRLVRTFLSALTPLAILSGFDQGSVHIHHRFLSFLSETTSTNRIDCNSQKTKHSFNSNRNSNRPFALSELLNFLPIRPPHQPSRLCGVVLMCRVVMSLIGQTSQARWITQTEL